VVAAVFIIVTIAVVLSHYPLRPVGPRQPRFHKGGGSNSVLPWDPLRPGFIAVS
jgi:hypothetical protein